MPLFDLILGPKCTDCHCRIKGPKFSLAGNEWLCPACKNARDETERKRREDEAAAEKKRLADEAAAAAERKRRQAQDNAEAMRETLPPANPSITSRPKCSHTFVSHGRYNVRCRNCGMIKDAGNHRW